MTHTLNRKGLSEDRPGEELVFLCMIPAKQRGTKNEQMLQMAETVLKYHPANIIFAPAGRTPDQIKELAARGTIITAVFNSAVEVKRLVEDIKKKNLGISVVLSGLFKDINEICRSAGLTEHTHNISLGIFGRTEKLPDEKTMQITTQCGHALISPHYVAHIVKQIRKGRLSSDEGAALLVKPCVCGIGNPVRIKKILEEMVRAE